MSWLRLSFLSRLHPGSSLRFDMPTSLFVLFDHWLLWVEFFKLFHMQKSLSYFLWAFPFIFFLRPTPFLKTRLLVLNFVIKVNYIFFRLINLLFKIVEEPSINIFKFHLITRFVHNKNVFLKMTHDGLKFLVFVNPFIVKGFL